MARDRLTLRERREANQWARQEFARQIGMGKTAKEAKAATLAAGEKKYGADWAKILEVILQLIELFTKLFG